jgi:protein-disulfide isomerase
MKTALAFFCLILFSFSIHAQTTEQVLATAGAQKFTVKDLPAEIGEAYTNLPKIIVEARKALLEQQVIEAVFEAEAKSKGLTIEKYLAQIKTKVPDPKEPEIQAIYDANREAFGEKTLPEVRPQIVAFLRRDPEQKALQASFTAIKAKFKILPGKDVNAPALKPADVLVTVGAKPITAKIFEDANRIILYETRAKVLDNVKYALNQLIFNALVNTEAKSLNLQTYELIAREVTDKMRDYSDEERDTLEADFRRRLYAKYKTQILLKEPAPLVLNISTENAASRGNAAAPVTVVMFSDFQCPVCSRTHPVLQKVLAEYGDKIRFVVRNFPLISLHENAFQAALAAQAAKTQGKFFEYTDILYKNQNALDTDSLKKYAVDAGLNLQQFELDLQSASTAEAVRKDMADGESYGITGTPTIFVNGVKVRVNSAEGFRDAIEKALKK